MVEYKASRLNLIFHALADATRRQLLQSIGKHTVCNITQLAEPFSISLNAISKHLKVLESADLIKRQRVGRTHYLALNHQPLKEAVELIQQLEQYWETRLDSLEDFFKSSKSGE